MTVFAVTLSWWVTWPQRKTSRFINLMATAPDRAEKMSPFSGMWRVMRERGHDRPYLEPHSRSLADILRGSQTFTVVLPVVGMEDDLIGTLHFEQGTLRGPIELDSRPKRTRE